MNTSSSINPGSVEGEGFAQSVAKKTTSFYRLTNEEWLKTTAALKNAEVVLLYYIRTLDPLDELKLNLSVTGLAKALRFTPSTISRALRTLDSRGYVDAQRYVSFREQDNAEQRIRDLLHQELGGLIEVATPAGRIDLLTETEIIEVKQAQDWKTALGQVLAYSGFYPEHQKRIHLFGEAHHISYVKAAKNICEEFAIAVTFEGVQTDV
ncbi:MAG: hypothetical protein LH702_35360 [Phormidesmis sp. CAN_BIN44]|nr:hypothetical protein [Phormidesmis sp. CAN_BIN44]